MEITYKLLELADYVSADLIGDGNIVIYAINTLTSAKNNQIAFFNNPKYKNHLIHTKAVAVILKDQHKKLSPTNNLLITSDPYVAYAKLSKLFYESKSYNNNQPSIDKTVKLGKNVVLENNTKIGANVIIGANSFIGYGSVVGAGTVIHTNTSIYSDTKIGKNCIIHSGVVIGSDGFGFARVNNSWDKIYQLGRVSIGDNVEIGANTTIDRGALEDTVINNNVKLDNQIQIGHNVVIGEGTIIAGCAGIAGSTIIGKNCMIGGGCRLNGHIEIADNVILTGATNVIKSITVPGTYYSTFGCFSAQEWRRVITKIRNFGIKKIKQL